MFWEIKDQTLYPKGHPLKDGKIDFSSISDVKNISISNSTAAASFTNLSNDLENIFVTGRSCGGWMSMMLLARYSDAAAGGISFMPACYGHLTKNYKVKKVGVDVALQKFREKDGPGPADMRQMQIDEIKKSQNLPVLVFSHPKDPFDGLLTDWVEDISGVKRIGENSKEYTLGAVSYTHLTLPTKA